MARCEDCIHYEPCYEYGNILDPIHGGVICDSFKPTSDVVAVVRCKDCKHRRTAIRCGLWCGSLGENEYFVEHGDDFYCSYGERKE